MQRYHLKRSKFSVTRGRLTGDRKKMSAIIKGIYCGMHYVRGEVDVYVDRYQNGRLAIQLADNEPVATVTVNLPQAPLGDNEIYVKDYSENAGATEFLVAAGIIQPQEVGWTTSGFAVINRHKLTDAFIAKLAEHFKQSA